MAATTALLELESVGVRLGGRSVLEGVSFGAARGDVVGLLGVNGAGKSTTLSIIAGTLRQDTGRVLIEGSDLRDDHRARARRIGWVPESVPLWPELTVLEALDACGRLHGLGAAARSEASARELARLDLADVAHRPCGLLSLGQKRRVGLAQALLHDPDLLVLDEPGNGLDPIQTDQLRRLIAEIRSDRALVLSSHALDEVAAICNRVVILQAGRVRHAGALDGSVGKLGPLFRSIAAQPGATAT